MNPLYRFFKLNTLRGRINIVLISFMLLFLALVIFVTSITLARYNTTQVEALLQSKLSMLTDALDDQYYTLVGISQQMNASSAIGEKVAAFRRTSDKYDKIALSSEISENINAILFSHRNVTLAGYYFENEKDKTLKPLFMTMTPSHSDFNPNTLPLLLLINNIQFQACHESLSMLNNKPTISAIQQTIINDETVYVYVERFADFNDDLAIISDNEVFPCTLLMLDSNNCVAYASNDAYAQGVSYQDIEMQNDAIFVQQRSLFGFSYVLTIPHRTGSQIISHWGKNILLVALFICVLLLIFIFYLDHMIFTQLRAFSREVEQIGLGDLSPAEHVFDLEEMSELFDKIETMKAQINELVQNIKKSEKEKRKLETDKLYYQINPHFLMNALNSLHWLAATDKKKETVRFVHLLNQSLSYSLGKTRQDTTFQSEVDIALVYVELQHMRYDFNCEINVEEGEYLHKHCPRLIIQPLLENAICHNMNDFDQLTLNVSQVDDKHVRIEVTDDGCGISTIPPDGTALSKAQISKGIGLKYLQSTLESYYGDEAQIMIDSVSGKGTHITLVLPLS